MMKRKREWERIRIQGVGEDVNERRGVKRRREE